MADWQSKDEDLPFPAQIRSAEGGSVERERSVSSSDLEKSSFITFHFAIFHPVFLLVRLQSGRDHLSIPLSELLCFIVAESSVFAYHIQLIFCSRPSAGYIVY
jgi:hypothetical protein